MDCDDFIRSSIIQKKGEKREEEGGGRRKRRRRRILQANIQMTFTGKIDFWMMVRFR